MKPHFNLHKNAIFPSRIGEKGPAMRNGGLFF